MGSLNTMRVVLVATAVLAAVVAGVVGQWAVAGVLAVAIVLHGVMWLYLPRLYGRRAGEEPPSDP